MHGCPSRLGPYLEVPWNNAFLPGLTPLGPPMGQAKADTELTLSTSPTTAVGQKALALDKRRYPTVECMNQKTHVVGDHGLRVFAASSSAFGDKAQTKDSHIS